MHQAPSVLQGRGGMSSLWGVWHQDEALWHGPMPCEGGEGQGLFGRDLCKGFVALWNGTLRQMDSLGLSLFCKSLQGGRCGTDALLPFQSEKDHVNSVLLSERWRGGGLSWWGIR